MIITIKDDHGGTVTIERPVLTCQDVVDDLVVPALLGIGYHPDTVRDAIAGVE